MKRVSPTAPNRVRAKRAANRPSQASAVPVVVDGRFINRDESWLPFNARVLEEAMDLANPLLERLKFLAITASNLDEFVEIRVAGTIQRLEEDLGLPQAPDEGGYTLDQRMDRLQDRLHTFTQSQDTCWNDHLEPELRKAGIRIVGWKNLREPDRLFAARYFHDQVDPLLTPVTLDPSHPFPRVLNKSLCLALLLRHKRNAHRKHHSPTHLGVVTIPRSLPSLISLPERNGNRYFLPLEELIKAHAEGMFRGYGIQHCVAFRVTRNSNLYLEEEESRSVLESVRSELHNRRKGDVVRMEIDARANEEITERLRNNFELDGWQVFRTLAPVNLSRLTEIYSALKRPDLKFVEFHGRRFTFGAKSLDIFDEIRSHDILLHHPFDSFHTVESFIEAATSDPRVMSIKQTLYRTSEDSSIFTPLTDAAQRKDVTVVVELMARFDEASNIRWARELEDAGVQVFHGIFGLKTHCKLALLVRRDPDGVTRSYAHLGTGNYNPVTARFYTDVSLLTARPEITEAVQHVFRYLTADWQTDSEAYRPLEVAPLTLADDIKFLIDREAAHARKGVKARIVAKMNALLDAGTIEALYAASQAGVEIDLIVRGMCALRPGVKGLSERIRVRSIVGRFLEHTRIFWFTNGGNEEVFAGSADWMQRNLYERCEVVFPVVDKAASKRLREEILGAYLRDTAKSRIMQPDGTYTRPSSSSALFNAQEFLMGLVTAPVSSATVRPPTAATRPTARRT
ncbi:MAG: polyphosphate kinase 1 [Bryocella sp.]